MSLDESVGILVETLKASGQFDNTLIVFTSDHGDLCGEHGRLNKGVPYEGSARIPFLLHCPGKVPAGTIVDEALSCVDFLPTTLSLMEVKTVGKEQGRDASALFRGKGKNWNDVAFIRSTSTGKPWLCAVTDDHKLVFSAMDEPWLLDLSEDPDEMDNCYEIPKYSKVVLRLTKALESYCRKYEDPYGEVPEIKAAIKQALGKK